MGTPIYAAQSGVVTYAGQTRGGYGIHVILNHGGGVQTLYGHCSGLAVSAGQVGQQGQVIAHVGSTGNSTGNTATLKSSSTARGSTVPPMWASEAKRGSMPQKESRVRAAGRGPQRRHGHSKRARAWTGTRALFWCGRGKTPGAAETLRQRAAGTPAGPVLWRAAGAGRIFFRLFF